MVVVIGLSLVGISWIKGDRLIRVGVPVPDTVARESRPRPGVAAIVVGIRKGVTTVEHGDAIDEVTDSAESCGYLWVWRSRGGARNAIGDSAVGGVVNKEIGLLLVPIPGPHNMKAKAGRTNENVGSRVADFVNTSIGRQSLDAGTTIPCRDCVLIALIFEGFVNSGVLARFLGEPGGQNRFGLQHSGKPTEEQSAEQKT